MTTENILVSEQGTEDSCTCEECQSYCLNKPGWFKPGEPERVADFLGVSIRELFMSRLGVDWWAREGDLDHNIFLLSPAITTSPSGKEFPGNPKGQCVFFKNGLCEIHPVKPYECRKSWHGNNNPSQHGEVAMTWDTQESRENIKGLLGREPEATNLTIFDLFDLFDILDTEESG